MMKQYPISVFIVTLNEAENIERVLRSVDFADEVIVVDSGSTDNTVALAEALGAKVVFNEWPGYAKQKQFAMQLCKHDWVLNLDADEEVTPELARQYQSLINQDKYVSVRCTREDLFIGQKMSPWTKKPNNNRLYRKSLSNFDATRLVHESADVDGKEIFIKASLIHYGYGTIEVLTDKNNQYSSLKAQEKFSKNKSYSLVKLVTIFPLIFIKEYIFQRKLFSGIRGFTLSIMLAYYAFIKEAKLYELHHTSNQMKDKNEKDEF